jgi:hypothetical protein
VAIASVGLLVSTSVWAIALVGYFTRPLAWGDRLLLMACSLAAIVTPTGSMIWLIGSGTAIAFLTLNWMLPAFSVGTLMPAKAGAGDRSSRASEPR